MQLALDCHSRSCRSHSEAMSTGTPPLATRCGIGVITIVSSSLIPTACARGTFKKTREFTTESVFPSVRNRNSVHHRRDSGLGPGGTEGSRRCSGRTHRRLGPREAP
jgi:hypothetical protein